MVMVKYVTGPAKTGHVGTMSYFSALHGTGYSIQKQPSCNKVCGPQESHCEKRCKIQSGSQEMAVNSKNFNNNNSGKFVLPSPRFTRIRHKIQLTCCYYNFAIKLPSQPFLDHHLDLFSQWPSWRPHTFFTTWLFFD